MFVGKRGLILWVSPLNRAVTNPPWLLWAYSSFNWTQMQKWTKELPSYTIPHLLKNYCQHQLSWNHSDFLNALKYSPGLRIHIRDVKYHVYVKRQMRICTTWPSFPITRCLLFIISADKLVVPLKILSIIIVLSCVYLLMFYFEKFSTWIWCLLFAL